MDRSTEVRKALDLILDNVEALPVGSPLVWLYAWDVIKTEYEDMSQEDGYTESNPSYTLDDVWAKFWVSTNFTLEYGTEHIYESVRDWLIENEFIIETEDN